MLEEFIIDYGLGNKVIILSQTIEKTIKYGMRVITPRTTTELSVEPDEVINMLHQAISSQVRVLASTN